MNTKFKGKVIAKIAGLEVDSDIVEIIFDDESVITFYHDQDCCEWVRVTQIDNEVERHIGGIFVGINEKTTHTVEDCYESCTATFYDIVTSRGYLSFRWTGESNGYYSEYVDVRYDEKEEEE